jgi:hypothetical protein
MGDAMDSAEWVPADIDLARPNAARVYDYYLGGSHNFAVDREMAKRAIELWPEVPMIIQANRSFLRRAVSFLVHQGVRQFLDLGAGIPTVGAVHQIAQQIDPETRVVYVDSDPVAVAHSRLIVGGNPLVGCVRADLREPDRVLAEPGLSELIDLRQPLAVLMVAVLHFVPDQDGPDAIVARYREALPPGSFLVVSHATADGQTELATPHQALYARTATPMTMRSRSRVAELLAGWDLLEPGLVRLPLWRPESDRYLAADPDHFAGYAAVASNPAAGQPATG